MSREATAGPCDFAAPVCAGCVRKRVCAYRGDPAEARQRAPAQVRFTRMAPCALLDPEPITGLLEGMESELRMRFEAEPDGKLMRLLSEALSLSGR